MESEKRTWGLYARGLPRASSRHSLILGPSILMVSEERPLLPSVMFHFLLFRPKQVSYIIYGRLPFHITVKAWLTMPQSTESLDWPGLFFLEIKIYVQTNVNCTLIYGALWFTGLIPSPQRPGKSGFYCIISDLLDIFFLINVYDIFGGGGQLAIHKMICVKLISRSKKSM